SDIFSLGIVLYELLTGIRPFDGDSNDTILSKIIVETLKPIRLNTKNISTKMEEIIDRCLEKDPSKRYKTISRLLIDLLSIKQDSESLQKGESKYELKDKRAIETHEQERRQVTVMFVAIANYKRILSVNDPEEASTAVNHLYDLLASVVEKYSGRIDKIVSGTIQIIYGAPVASENANKEALNTAIEIRNKNAKYNQIQKIQIELKIGINSGIVIAGIMRTDDKKNYTVFGETVNHASNLKDLCENGQIYVGSLVYKLTKNEFEYKVLSPIFLKENESKSAVYILLSVKEKIHRAKLGSGRQIYSQMVGRDKELIKLELRVSKLINGEGFIVNVIGEAGIGKSRLKAELRDNDKITQVTFLEGRSLSIGKNLSFHPFIDFLKNWSGITENDAEKDAFRKLENLVRDIYPENLEE
ncbi:MAG: protein kinase, partial [Melioribacteraceae bacterium]|nr:protein kinase [Melioribacteraceae bacterium]